MLPNFILTALLAIGAVAVSNSAFAQDCPCGVECPCGEACPCPTLADCPDGQCAKPAAIVEGPQHSVLARQPIRRVAALPAKALKHTAQAVREGRPARRLLKAVARVAAAPFKAIRRARCH
jgi:hypothetical protein